MRVTSKDKGLGLSQDKGLGLSQDKGLGLSFYLSLMNFLPPNPRKCTQPS